MKYRIVGFAALIGLAVIILPFIFAGSDNNKSEQPSDTHNETALATTTAPGTTQQGNTIPLAIKPLQTAENDIQPSSVINKVPNNVGMNNSVATPTNVTVGQPTIPATNEVAVNAAPASTATSTLPTTPAVNTAQNFTQTQTGTEPSVPAMQAASASNNSSAQPATAQPQQTMPVNTSPSSTTAPTTSEEFKLPTEETAPKAKPVKHNDRTKTGKPKHKLAADNSKSKSSSKHHTQTAANSHKSAKPTKLAHGAGWIVQLGSFSNKSNADKLVHQLRAKGFSAHTTVIAGNLTRVYIGPENGRSKADQTLKKIETELNLSGVVVKSEA
ncbi:MAG: SPOR domain-containing protein [Coxiellaceae bacterium]|nr:MAG: SPOR domain-containing protein [Coxiellaceae bacterium]